MNEATKAAPRAETIIARMDGGRSDLKLARDQIVYSQGDPADSVLYIASGRVKVTVVSEEGKEAVVRSSSPDISAARNASPATSCA